MTVWEVGTVDTGIHLKGEKGAPTPKKVVADVLTQIGKEKKTTGSLIFALKQIFLPPVWFLAPLMEKMMRKEHSDWVKLQNEKDAKSGYTQFTDEDDKKIN